MKTHHLSLKRFIAAFSLIEVTIALGVAGFCLIAIMGLLPAGLSTNQSATRQTTANNILAAITADLRSTLKSPTQWTSSPRFQITVPKQGSSSMSTLFCDINGACWVPQGGESDDDEGGSGPSNSTAVYKATITFADNGSSTDRTASFADVVVAWPIAGGGGSQSDEQSDEETSGSTLPSTGGLIESFVGLDRN